MDIHHGDKSQGRTVQHAARNLQPPSQIQNRSLGHWSAEKVELQRIRGMTLSFLSIPVSIPQLIYRSCTISHYLSMSQEGGKTTAAFFDSVSVARALSTIIQDLFKSGLKSVYKWTEDLSLSLLSLHLWPGKMTSVSKSTAQT